MCFQFRVFIGLLLLLDCLWAVSDQKGQPWHPNWSEIVIFIAHYVKIWHTGSMLTPCNMTSWNHGETWWNVRSDSVSHLQMTTLTLCEAGSYRCHLHSTRSYTVPGTASTPELHQFFIPFESFECPMSWGLKGIHPRSTRPCVCTCVRRNEGLDSGWSGWMVQCRTILFMDACMDNGLSATYALQPK